MRKTFSTTWRLLTEIRGFGDVLPTLATIITRSDRYKVDIEWSDKSVVHNLFRVHEMLFWRKWGIRIENSFSAEVDEDGIYTSTHHFYTLEAGLAFIESRIRESVPKLVVKRVLVPSFAGAPMLSPTGNPYLFAIAFDSASSTSAGSGTSLSVTQTCTGSDLVLFAFSWGNNTGLSLATSYNGTGMTTIDNQSVNFNTSRSNILVAPSTGANTLAVNTTNSFGLRLLGSSYTGCAQTGQPDGHSQSNTNNGSPFSMTVGDGATTAAGCWGVAACVAFGASSNAIQSPGVARSTTATTCIVGDTNGPVTAGGDASITFNVGSGNANCFAAGVGLAPVPAAGPANVKTWDGVSQATAIKTYNGVPVASTKGVIGVT